MRMSRLSAGSERSSLRRASSWSVWASRTDPPGDAGVRVLGFSIGSLPSSLALQGFSIFKVIEIHGDSYHFAYSARPVVGGLLRVWNDLALGGANMVSGV